MTSKRPDHGFGDPIDVPMRQRLSDDPNEFRSSNGIAEPNSMEAEVLAETLQNDDVSPLGRLSRNQLRQIAEAALLCLKVLERSPTQPGALAKLRAGVDFNVAKWKKDCSEDNRA